MNIEFIENKLKEELDIIKVVFELNQNFKVEELIIEKNRAFAYTNEINNLFAQIYITITDDTHNYIKVQTYTAIYYNSKISEKTIKVDEFIHYFSTTKDSYLEYEMLSSERKIKDKFKIAYKES